MATLDPWIPAVCKANRAFLGRAVRYQRGPIHRTSNFGSTWARKTRSSGAANSRVITIWGEPGSAVICVSAISAATSGSGGTLRRVLPIRLQHGEQLVESLVALIPEPLIAVQPRRRFAQGLGVQSAHSGRDHVTTSWWRKGRDPAMLFVDYNQNARDRTIASAYYCRFP